MKKIMKICMCLLMSGTLILGNTTLANVSAADKNSEKIIVINPGHQKKANLKKEAIGPGSKKKKYKVSGGTSGESSTNLAIAKKLKAELEKRGYKVYMTRTKQDVNISNKKRALYANKKEADAVISIHCDAGSKSAKGAHTIAPKSTKFVSKSVKKESQLLAKSVINSYCKKTGIKKLKSKKFQKKMAVGIANGIDNYFDK